MNNKLVLSVIAPIIGSYIGILRKPNKRLISHMFAFAGGIMICISLLELIPESLTYCNFKLCICGLIIGALILQLTDSLMVQYKNSNNIKSISILLCIGIAIHNISEGMTLALCTVLDQKLGFVVAFGIALHNIAEGICTSAPLYFSYNNKIKAFLISASTAIPLLIGYYLVKLFIPHTSRSFLGLLLSITSGLMIYITVNDLIPYSFSNKKHNVTYSFLLGVIIIIFLGNS